ncbi:MAG: DUF192 domain-containing protein [Betaproteobacteria bacterium]
MIRTVFLLLVGTLLAIAPGLALSAAELPTIPLSINGNKLVAETATTDEQITTGLMHRFSLKPDHGMVFVFDRQEPRTFWMKNTFIPLSIAFIAADGRILNIEDMAPQDESLHYSRGAAMYTLEMRKGWFAERGIRAGDRVSGLPPPKR